MNIREEMKKLNLTWGMIGDYLRHMTGSREKKYQGYRNYFSTNHQDPHMEFMESLGLVSLRVKNKNGCIYAATKDGCQLIGMTKAGMNRIFEGEKQCQ